MLTGYRTYICVTLSAVVVLAEAMGYIGPQLRDTLLESLGFSSAAALRAAIGKKGGK